MIRYELGDMDYLEHRIDRIRKEFNNLLKKAGYVRQKEMVRVLETLMNTTVIKKEKQLLDQLLEGVLKESSSDTDIINYRDWLTGKLN
jgi:hypothetical protein